VVEWVFGLCGGTAGGRRRSVVTGSFAGVLFPRRFVLGRRLLDPSLREYVAAKRGHIQAKGLHGIFHTIVPVWKAAPITGTWAKSRTREPLELASRPGIPNLWNRNCRQPKLHVAVNGSPRQWVTIDLYDAGLAIPCGSLAASPQCFLSGREDRALPRSNLSARPGLRSKRGRLRPPARFLASRRRLCLRPFEWSLRR
jgi:hypothetical protein